MTPAPQDQPASFPPPPAVATACPKCGAPATPAREARACEKCQTVFLLRAGALMDPAVKVPPADGAAKELKLKAPGLIVMSIGMIKADRVGFGALDPIVGRFPLDIEEKAVRFNYLYSVAVWRAINTAQAVTFFIISLPFALLGLGLAATLNPAGLIFGLLLVALSGLHGYRVFIRKAMRMRVVGFKDRVLDMTFVGTLAARQRFQDELFRRCGLEAATRP